MSALLFCILTLLWGGSFIAIKYTVTSLPPVTGAMTRVAIAFLFLLLFARLKQRPLALPKSARIKVWLTGLFSIGLPFALLFWAEQSVTPGLAGIINGTVPIWTTIFAMIFMSGLEPINEGKIFGLLLGSAGVYTIFSPSLSFGGNDLLLPMLALVLMSIFYSVGMLLNRSLMSGKAKIDLFANTVHQHGVSLIALLGLTLFLEGNPLPVLATQTSTAAAISLFYLGLFSNAIAFIIFFYLIKRWGAVRASTVTYVVPLVALTLDFLFLGTIPQWNELAGIGLILSGVLLIQSAKKGTGIFRFISNRPKLS